MLLHLPASHESSRQGVGSKDQIITFSVFFLREGFVQYPKSSSKMSKSVQIQSISNWVSWTRSLRVFRGLSDLDWIWVHVSEQSHFN